MPALFQNRQLADADFERIRKVVYEESGIALKDTKRLLVANRLATRLPELGLATFEDYCRYLAKPMNRRNEAVELLDRITTNETYFFRESDHYRALVEGVLPEILDGRPVRKAKIWSAGCSSGQEPYTLGMVLEEAKASLNMDYSITATDISKTVLATARSGRYKVPLRGLPDDCLKKYFAVGNGFAEVCPEIRKRIQFQELNFAHDFTPVRADVIFCRNVMIYFDEAMKRRLVDKFAAGLVKNGFLFIGRSESLNRVTERFSLIKSAGAMVYRKKD